MLADLSRALLGPALLVASVASCTGSDAAGRPVANALTPTGFDGALAMSYVIKQVEFGPRVPGTAAHRAAGDYLSAELRARADTVYEQRWTHTTADGQRLPMRNIIARFAPTAERRVLYLAHWDSRPRAEKDADPAKRTQAIPGANDGASGVAILLAVADLLKRQPANVGVDLVLVDGEDWGSFDTNTDILIGARYFAEHLPSANYAPVFGVLFDMVGDAFPSFLYESNSMVAAPEVVQRVWSTARRLGYETAFPTREYGPITDDHLPLIEKGLKVIDVIDLDYPWHHTTEDTPDKVSQRTLQMVGDVAVTLLREI